MTGHLDELHRAAAACTAEPNPDRWEWRGRAHLDGRCGCGPDVPLTDRQAEVFEIVAAGPHRGVMAWQVRDRIYAEDSRMRQYRPHRGASNWQGAQGGLGNLAAGRVLHALQRLGLVEQRWFAAEESDSNAWVLTAEGERLARRRRADRGERADGAT